ncbi:hypothetical protein GCM10027294_46440 [Marinactinospora endophytica]
MTSGTPRPASRPCPAGWTAFPVRPPRKGGRRRFAHQAAPLDQEPGGETIGAGGRRAAARPAGQRGRRALPAGPAAEAPTAQTGQVDAGTALGGRRPLGAPHRAPPGTRVG